MKLRIEESAESELPRRSLAIELLGYDPLENRAPNHETLPLHNTTQRHSRQLAAALIRQRDGDRCYLCRKPLEGREACIEHIIPLGLGGENTAANVALACYPCNTRKADQIVSFDVSSGRPCYHRLRT